jgi:tetratricopeptide (TPR) repeat protein
MAAGAAMNRAANFIWGEVLTLLLGEGYQLAGEYDDATRTLTALVERVEPRGMRFLCGSAHRLLGEVALQTNPTEAAPHFEHSITILREIKAENEVALAYAGYGRLHTQRGAIAQARDYFTQALAIFERLGTLGEPDKVRRALATLPENGDTR